MGEFCGPGQFNFAARVAIDPSGLNIYVCDAANNRVELFSYDSPADEPSKEAQYVYIDGLVTIPGRYPYTNGMTLDKGIKMARGVTVEAAVTKVTLIREGENPATLDLKAIQRGQTKDVELKPGDRVHVPER
jgi:hypothetical protein